jgi:hypothetical protein
LLGFSSLSFKSARGRENKGASLQVDKSLDVKEMECWQRKEKRKKKSQGTRVE